MFFLIVAMIFLGWPLLMLLVIGLTAQSLLSLVTAPQQLWELAHDKDRRRNHALEHATINVIEERYGASQLGGYALSDGFSIQGPADPRVLLDAAREGLRRLQAGEKRLAVHPRCGTTMLASSLVSAISFIVLLIVFGRLTLLSAFLALALAALLAKPLSAVLQRFITTSTDVQGLQITGIDYGSPRERWMLLFAGAPTQFRFYTSAGWVVLTPEQARKRHDAQLGSGR